MDHQALNNFLSDTVDENKKSYRLQGNIKGPICIFIHAIGTTPYDLLPLAFKFNEIGCTCELLYLKERSGKDSFAIWYEQLSSIYCKYDSLINEIYLISFSNGCILSLDFACQNKITAILTISSLFEYKKPSKLIKSTTISKTQNELQCNCDISKGTKKIFYKKSEYIKNIISKIQCPILFVHSTDDNISNYKRVIKILDKNDRSSFRFVPIRGLKHYVQFDIELASLRDLFLQFAIQNPKTINPECSQFFLKELFSEINQEHRHWSGILFQVIVAFFTLFGLFSKTALNDISNNPDRIPSYLIACSAIINIYLLLAALYFFYTNRTIVYQKHFIEPMVDKYSYVSYRTNPFASGKESEHMTQFVSLPVIVLPMLISIILLSYCFYSNYKILTAIDFDYMFFKISWIVTFLLWLFAIKSLDVMKKYTDRELYLMPRAKTSNLGFEASLSKFYSTINPGRIHQVDFIKKNSNRPT